MAETDRRVEIEFGVKLDELQQGLLQVATALRNLTDQVHKSGTGAEVTAGSMAKLGVVMTTVQWAIQQGTQAVMQIVTALPRWAEETAAAAREQQNLATFLGVSIEKIGVLREALSNVNATEQQATSVIQFMSRQMRTREERLQQLGVETRKANGALKDGIELMFAGIKAVNDHAEGMDRNAAATEIMGRNIRELQNLLRLTEAGFKESEVVAKDYGLTLSRAGQEDAAKFTDQSNKMHTSMEALRKAMGEPFVRVLSELKRWFTLSADGVKFWGDVANTVAGIVWFFMDGLYRLYLMIRTVTSTMMAMVSGVADIVSSGGLLSLLKGYFLGQNEDMGPLRNRLKAMWGDMKDAYGEGSEDYRKFQEERAAALAQQQSLGQYQPATKPDDKGKGKEYKPPSRGAMSEWQIALNKEKLDWEKYDEASDQWRVWTLEKERDFWQRIKAGQVAGVPAPSNLQERRAVELKILESDLRINQERLKAMRQIRAAEISEIRFNLDEKLKLQLEEQRKVEEAAGGDMKNPAVLTAQAQTRQIRAAIQERTIQLRELEIGAAESRAMFLLDIERASLEQQKELRGVDQKQYLVQLQQFEDRDYAIRAEALNKRIRLIQSRTDDSGNLSEVDLVALRRAEEDKTKLTEDHLKRRLDLTKQYAVEQSKLYMESLDILERGFSKFFEDILTGTKSLKASLLDFFQMIWREVTNLIAKQLGKQLMDSLGLGPGGGGQGTGTLGGLIGGGLRGLLGGSAPALPAVAFGGENAWEAENLATRVGGGGLGGMLSGAWSWVKGLFGAAGGLDFVPKDMPIYVHKGERILTAEENVLWGESLKRLRGLMTGVGMPQLAMGTSFVPFDMPAFLHRGEAVIPASENRMPGRKVSVTNNFRIDGGASHKAQQQIAARVGRSVRDAMARSGGNG